MSATLLESIEGLGHSPFVMDPAEAWERLQAEKETVSRDLLAAGALGTSDNHLLESASADEYARERRWRHRRQLEARLHEINEAQDRLMDGSYGRCANCAEEIDSSRLAADAAAARCSDCIAYELIVENVFNSPGSWEIESIH